MDKKGRNWRVKRVGTVENLLKVGVEGIGCEDFGDSFNGWEAVEKGRDFFEGFIGGLAFNDEARDSRVALAEAPRDLRG